METAINLYAKELAELEAHEREMEEAAGMIREKVVLFGRHLSEIHLSGCWKAKYESFDDYCLQRWRFTGARGRQLVDAYGVAKNLAAMTEETRLPSFMFEYFTESHARVLKQLPPEQQRDAWQATVSAAAKNGTTPTAKALTAAVEAAEPAPAVPTPEDVYAMGRDEQHSTIARMEEAAEASFIQQRQLELLALAQKRFRSVLEDMRHERFGDTFTKGDYHVKGGLVGLGTTMQDEIREMQERLTGPLFEEST